MSQQILGTQSLKAFSSTIQDRVALLYSSLYIHYYILKPAFLLLSESMTTSGEAWQVARWDDATVVSGRHDGGV
jgi:hypothetical protein